jgi:hypothetical protein
VWVGSHAASSVAGADVKESTGGVISNSAAAESREIPGTATARAVVAITGGVHEVTTADPRSVEVKIVGA